MSRADDLLVAALTLLPEKPPDSAKASIKKRYSELMSQVVAGALAEELRNRGLRETRPGGVGEIGKTGAERRMSGGIGAKKVDVTWATQESGLILAISVKCLTSKDQGTGNYQKNLINRRGDLLGEAVTLHRRFPYAVLGGFFFLDKGAAEDQTSERSSTFLNTHRAFRIFTGRSDPTGRDEQYERLYVVLIEASPFACTYRVTLAGKPDEPLTLDQALDELLKVVVERDPDFYTVLGPNGEIDPSPSASPTSLHRIKSSGVLMKGKPPAKPKGKKEPPKKLSLETPLVDDEEEEEEDEHE